MNNETMSETMDQMATREAKIFAFKQLMWQREEERRQKLMGDRATTDEWSQYCGFLQHLEEEWTGGDIQAADCWEEECKKLFAAIQERVYRVSLSLEVGPKAYFLGYKSQSRKIEELMEMYPEALLIDSRKSPGSNVRGWKHVAMYNQECLQKVYGKRYLWEGQYLGNVNYNRPGMPHKLADEKSGIPRLRNMLRRGHVLVIICGCLEYELCHRSDIRDLLEEHWEGYSYLGELQIFTE